MQDFFLKKDSRKKYHLPSHSYYHDYTLQNQDMWERTVCGHSLQGSRSKPSQNIKYKSIADESRAN